VKILLYAVLAALLGIAIVLVPLQIAGFTPDEQQYSGTQSQPSKLRGIESFRSSPGQAFTIMVPATGLMAGLVVYLIARRRVYGAPS